MSSRAKISVMLALVGVLPLGAASLNPAQKNTRFQPGRPASISQVKIIKPAKSSPWAQLSLGRGNVKVHSIAPVVQTSAPVEISGFVFQRAAQAPAEQTAALKTTAGRD